MSKKQTTIMVSGLTLKLLKHHYQQDNYFTIERNDIYHNRLLSKIELHLSTVKLDKEAHLFLDKSSYKINANIGYYLHAGSLYDMTNWLMEYTQKTGKIKEGIYQFLDEYHIEDEDYSTANALKHFYRFRKNKEKTRKNANYFTNNATLFEKHVLKLCDTFATLEDTVLEKTAILFKIDKESILSPSRKIQVTNARHTCFYLLHKAGLSTREISERLSRHHSSIAKAIQKIETDIKINNGTGRRAKALHNSLFDTPI